MIIEKKSKDQKNFTLKYIDLSHIILDGLNVGNFTPKISTESQDVKNLPIVEFTNHSIKRLTFFFNF